MKRYAFGIFAVVLAVGFSAFTVTSVKVVKWFPYNSGAQTVASNYGTAVTLDCPGSTSLCAIRVDDINNDGVLSQAELNAALPTLDPDSDGNIQEHGERANIAEFKTIE